MILDLGFSGFFGFHAFMCINARLHRNLHLVRIYDFALILGVEDFGVECFRNFRFLLSKTMLQI